MMNANDRPQTDLIKDLTRRRSSMDSEFSDWEDHFRRLRKNILPTHGRFDLGEKKGSSTLNTQIIDSTALRAWKTLRSGMMAGITSPSRPWFRLGLHYGHDTENPAIKSYMHQTTARMYAVLRGSNMYRILDAAYGDIGLFGTFAGLVVGNFDDVVRGHHFPMGSYRIADNEDGRVSVLHWETKMTVSQVISKFGEESVSASVRNRFKNNDMHTPVDICAAVEVREDHIPGSPLPKHQPLAVYYWEKTRKDKLLMVSGHKTNGILGARWDKMEGETYSITSPGQDALGDCVQLQTQMIDKAKAVKTSYDPPMVGPQGFKASKYRNIPGKMTTMNTMDLQAGGLRPAHEGRTDLQWLLHDIQETRERISQCFYEDLFRMASREGIEGVKNVTATAIAEMHEEKLIALGPVMESLDHSLLTPIIESVFHYMQEAEITPPAPPELDGKPIKVEFIGLLAQAQKAIGLASIERTVGFVGSAAQLDPSALDKLDIDQTIDSFAEQVGPPPDIIRTTEQAGEIRQARAQQAQQQQMIENAQPVAQAAKLISEVSDRGAEGLERAAGV